MTSGDMSTQALWDLLANDLRCFLRKRTPSESVAEDLLQETFLRVHRQRDQLQDEERVGSWVFRIARNLVIDYYRTEARKSDQANSLGPQELEAGNNEETNLNHQVGQWILAFIEQLPETHREAVRMYEVSRLPQAEIAQRLKLSLSGVKSRIQRGRAKLKEMLHDCCSFEVDARGNLLDYRKNGPSCHLPSRSNDCQC